MSAGSSRPGLRDSLVGAVLAAQRDEWTEMHRHIGVDIHARPRLSTISNGTDRRRSEVIENLETISD